MIKKENEDDETSSSKRLLLLLIQTIKSPDNLHRFTNFVISPSKTRETINFNCLLLEPMMMLENLFGREEEEEGGEIKVMDGLMSTIFGGKKV